MNKNYIPSLDGLRAFAVILVFLSHANLGHIVPGGLGVTLFFFLSGLLITSLLIHEFEYTGKISFKMFYQRRIYRLFPPLYIVLFFSLILSLTNVLSSDLSLMGVASQFFQFTNYYIVLAEKEGLLPGLGVLWSLAVEEHFYLIFPILLFLCLKYFSKKTLVISIIVGIFICLGWRIILVLNFNVLDQHYLYTYHATDTRFDSILFGCLMACLFDMKKLAHFNYEEHSNIKRDLFLFILSIVAIFSTLLYRDDFFRETFRYTIQGFSFFAIFYFLVKYKKNIFYKILNQKYIIYLGKISYTFYLCHYIMIFLAVSLFGDSTFNKLLFGFIFSLIFSALMYKYVETYFAKKRKKLHED